MKKIISAVCAAFLSLSVFGGDFANIMDYVPLKDGVKSYTKTEYSIATKFGDYFKTSKDKEVHTLDAAGNDIDITVISPRGDTVYTVKTTFDSMGNSLLQLGLDGKGETMWKTEYVYKKGAKTEANDFDASGKLNSKTIYKYENDQMVDETCYNGKGALVWKTIYKYDEAGRISNVCEYHADGTLDAETVYAYKEDGKLESLTVTDSEDTVQNVFRYSAAGQLTEITTYKVRETGNKLTDRKIIKYDDKGCVTKVSDYVVSDKFGGTVNELVDMAEYTYTF